MIRAIGHLALLVVLSNIALAASPDDSIKAVRAHYRDVLTNARRYKKLVRNVVVSTEGGQVVLWLDGEQLVRAEASYFGESGDAHDELYFRDGQLVFAFSVQVAHAPIFDKNGEFTTAYDEDKVVKRTTLRVYLDHGYVLRIVSNGTKPRTTPASKDEAERIAHLVREAEVYQKGALTKESFGDEDFR